LNNDGLLYFSQIPLRPTISIAPRIRQIEAFERNFSLPLSGIAVFS